jgi:hypothetical protein
MNGEAIVSVSAAVVALTQIVKWAGLRDNHGPLVVMILSFMGTAFWGWSVGDFSRTAAFGYFAGWIAVMTSAAGVYGFTRAGGEAISRMTAPPITGAGSETTVKS